MGGLPHNYQAETKSQNNKQNTQLKNQIDQKEKERDAIGALQNWMKVSL